MKYTPEDLEKQANILLMSGLSPTEYFLYGIKERPQPWLELFPTYDYNRQIVRYEDTIEQSNTTIYIARMLLSGLENNTLFFPQLTERQHLVAVLLIASGLSLAGCARQLGIKKQSITQLVQHIQRKAQPYYIQIRGGYNE